MAASASISGVVTDDAEPARPVRRAVVTLTGDGLQPGRGAITNDDGGFTLGGLPAGRFTLRAERGGYVTSAYGAKRPGRAGTAITLADGQQITDLRVRLWRGAVLSGVLRDEWGAPLVNTEVAAIPTREVTPVALTLSNSAQARTNDLGEYRIFGLEPGTYVLRAGVDRLGSPAVAMSAAEVDATFAMLAARTRFTGAVPTPRGVSPAASEIHPPGTRVSMAPSYYPGTAVLAHALPITLDAGEERGGLDFVVQQVRTATIRGTVARPDGLPVSGAFLQLAAAPGPLTSAGSSSPPMSTTSGPDGAFELGPLPPGDYRLLARGASGSAVGNETSGPYGWAQMAISVSGDDIDLARVTLERGMTFSGRVVVDDRATSRPPDLATLRVQLEGESLVAAPSQMRRGGPPGLRFLPPAAVAADGSFSVADLVPDVYRVTLVGGALDSGWWLRSVMWQGRDLLDVPQPIEPGMDMAGVVLLLSDVRTELSGTLTTAGGEAFSDVFVLVFPADPGLRVPRSRRVQAVRPDSSGRFVFGNLPGGAYFISALMDVDEGEWNGPGFFDSLVAASVRISLVDGENAVQDLRVGGR